MRGDHPRPDMNGKRHACNQCGQSGHNEASCVNDGKPHQGDSKLVRCPGGCGAMLWIESAHRGDTLASHKCPPPKSDPHARPGDFMIRGSQ